MTAYYNEIDKHAAQWLRNLIDAGHIAPGYVDDRSIEDVFPSDLRGFTQCHFFAGIGVWSYALRQSGWSDDRPVWTGSCPCQPFSAAGKGSGFDDERHLWPAFHHLISQCKPAIVLGEQVASKDADTWIDLVHTDLEAMGYAFGAIPFPSAGVGAPHIRDRLYWVANAADQRFDRWRPSSTRDGRDATRQQSERLCDAGGLAHLHSDGRDQTGPCFATTGGDGPVGDGSAGWMADTQHDGCGGQESHQAKPNGNRENFGLLDRGHFAPQGQPATGPTNGYWRDADWLYCRDGKWRPVEPGTFPLANGAPARVGRLRAYGNAINAEAARVFIEAVMECAP